jgi:RNA polymerase sigma-70 factor, ECF subfamily
VDILIIAKDLSERAVLTSKDRMNLYKGDAPDAQLVSRACAGDASAFEVLFDRYYDMIHAFAYRVCLAEAEAEDIAQETFIRAARGLAHFRGEASLKNWLFRIAHHAVIDWGRETTRRRDRDAAFAAEIEASSPNRPADYTEVHAALHRLPPDWREAVALVFFEEMNHREAASVLGCAETTVSWRIFRAKRMLREWLQPKKREARHE